MSRTVTDTPGTAGSIVLSGEALAGAWWRCGEGWIWDEADMKDAAEYLRAVARSN